MSQAEFALSVVGLFISCMGLFTGFPTPRGLFPPLRIWVRQWCLSLKYSKQKAQEIMANGCCSCYYYFSCKGIPHEVEPHYDFKIRQQKEDLCLTCAHRLHVKLHQAAAADEEAPAEIRELSLHAEPFAIGRPVQAPVWGSEIKVATVSFAPTSAWPVDAHSKYFFIRYQNHPRWLLRTGSLEELINTYGRPTLSALPERAALDLLNRVGENKESMAPYESVICGPQSLTYSDLRIMLKSIVERYREASRERYGRRYPFAQLILTISSSVVRMGGGRNYRNRNSTSVPPGTAA